MMFIKNILDNLILLNHLRRESTLPSNSNCFKCSRSEGSQRLFYYKACLSKKTSLLIALRIFGIQWCIIDYLVKPYVFFGKNNKSNSTVFKTISATRLSKKIVLEKRRKENSANLSLFCASKPKN